MSAPPLSSDVGPLRNLQGVVHFCSKTPDCALDLGMIEQQSDRAQLAGASANQGRLRAAYASRPRRHVHLLSIKLRTKVSRFPV